jgi:phospholipid transport system substrate-binding protein
MKSAWIGAALLEAVIVSFAVPLVIPAAENAATATLDRPTGNKVIVESNEEIKRLQAALKSKGEDPGAIDGIMGEKTAAALRAFQKANDLKVTGALDDQTAAKLGIEKRRLVRDAMSPRYDFQEMAERVLGDEWRRRTPKEQAEFVQLFGEFMENAVVRRIQPYSNEEIRYTGSSDESYAQVASKLRIPTGEEFKINYMLRRPKSEWTIYDVVVEDVSLIKNYHSQFSRVIANSSYEELVRRLRNKQKEFADKSRCGVEKCD